MINSLIILIFVDNNINILLRQLLQLKIILAIQNNA